MPEPDLVVAVDVGTTNVKAAVVDVTGHLLRISSREMALQQDEEGRAEHDPDELFAAFTDTIREASQGSEERIALLAPATYQMGLMAVDAEDRPLTGMMTLLDTRARHTHAELLTIFGESTLYDRTGCPPVFHYPLAKMFWLKMKRPDLFKRTACFLSSKDFLLRRLAAYKSADVSVSSTSQYMNIGSLTWDDEILAAIGVSSDVLPPLSRPETVIADNLNSVKEFLGLPHLAGILLGAYDGGAVGIGLGAMAGDAAVMNFGTTAMLRHVSDGPALSKDGSMKIQSSFLAEGKYIPGGAINNAGAVLRWLRDNIFQADYEALTTDARAAGDSAGLIFLPYLSGERSIDIGADASGSFFGLRNHHTRGNLVRAAFEGVAFSLRRVKDALGESGVTPKIIRAGSGGSHSAVWMEIVASVLNTPLQTTQAQEPGLLGSAMMGFTALNRYSSLEEATRAMVRTDRTYSPHPASLANYDSAYERFNYLTAQMREFDDKFD